MGAKSSAGNGGATGDYEVIAAGPVAGRCIGVIELGTHKNTHPQAAPDAVKKELMIIWETNELMQDGRPFTVNWRGTNSLGTKAVLYKMLTSWRGRAFTAEELKNFELCKILNAPCLLNIVVKDSKDGTKKYANVDSVMPLPKGMVCNELVNPLVDFGIDDRNNSEIFDKIWPWVQNIIKESYEAKGIPIPGEETVEPAGQGEPELPGENEIPF